MQDRQTGDFAVMLGHIASFGKQPFNGNILVQLIPVEAIAGVVDMVPLSLVGRSS